MEKTKLPNVNTAMILGIISFIGCCCSSGILGVILSLVALNYTKKDEKLYQENPDLYENYSQLKTAKIIAIVGLVLAAIQVLYLLFIIATGNFAQQMEEMRELMEQMQNK